MSAICPGPVRMRIWPLFSDSTEVLASRVIIDRATGRSKGFGFVEVPDEQAEQVIAAMNGKELGGREIIVNEARPLNTTS